jgi:hypothetical protein
MARLDEQQGNRWFAIKYRGSGGRPAWGSPFWADQRSALQLLTPGAELWRWIGGAWQRFF